MPDLERLTITLPAPLAADIKNAIEGGEYASASEVIREALRDWRTKRALQLQELAALKKEHGYNYLIEIDGSCNTKTFHDLLGAGAEVLIVGTSGLFNLDPNLAVAWDKMTANIRQAEQAA